MRVSVGWERYGLQSDLEYFEERQKLEKVRFNITELNWSNNSAQSKGARIDRLEPDFRNKRFKLPSAIWRDGKPQVWHVNDDPEHKQYQTIVYDDFRGLSKKQQELFEGGQSEMLAKCIKRLDSEKQTYDFTIRFIEEFLSYPYGAHDDLLDACSRFYDMDMEEPMSYSSTVLDPPVFMDS